jgi:hypothetical protein
MHNRKFDLACIVTRMTFKILTRASLKRILEQSGSRLCNHDCCVLTLCKWVYCTHFVPYHGSYLNKDDYVAGLVLVSSHPTGNRWHMCVS